MKYIKLDNEIDGMLSDAIRYNIIHTSVWKPNYAIYQQIGDGLDIKLRLSEAGQMAEHIYGALLNDIQNENNGL